MWFKPIGRCVCLRIWPKSGRLFSTQNELLSNSKTESIASLLREYQFSDKQIDSVFKSIGQYIAAENELNQRSMRETIECWQSAIKAPKLRANQWDKISPEDIDFDMSVDLKYVLSQIEPKLLLMNANAIEYRIKNIKDLAILGGARDLWRVLVYAPNGYYLQNWADFMKKYHYLTYRVLDWLLDKKDKDNLHPHPLIRNSRVMELAFETIRCRYQFARRTGLKTISITSKLSDRDKLAQIDLRDLMLTPVERYLKLVSPHCTVEEYTAFDSLLNERPPEEDEQIIEDMVELTANQRRDFKKWSNRQKKGEQNPIERTFQIITPIE